MSIAGKSRSTTNKKTQMHQRTFDREGRSYTISISENDLLLSIRLYDLQTVVGEAKCVRESPETLFLKDVAIANNVRLTLFNNRAALLRRLPRYRPKRISYRGKGLGTVLLSCLIDHARVGGVRYLYGKVMRQDLENISKLLQWYQKHGFEIKQPTSEDDPDITAWVHLHL